MDDYDMGPIRKIKTHKKYMYVHVSQNCSDYKLITMFIPHVFEVVPQW